MTVTVTVAVAGAGRRYGFCSGEWSAARPPMADMRNAGPLGRCMNEKEPFGSDAVCRTGLRDKDNN